MSGPERREYERSEVTLEGVLSFPEEGTEFPCKIRDISVGGAKIGFDEAKDKSLIGRTVVLTLALYGSFDGEIMWIKQNNAGINFTGDKAANAQALIALLSYGV